MQQALKLNKITYSKDNNIIIEEEKKEKKALLRPIKRLSSI